MTLSELNNYEKLVIERHNICRRLEAGKGTGELKRRLREINRRISKIADFIQGCSDPLVKQIMIYRFIEKLSWDSVAAKVGCSSTPDSCRMMASRYINRNME